eukprot:TRINITY_DN3511_c2_g1_i1.p1 TRINITY_DN3511_c2_g1~~TRINITY_DN3511_c2_g1_i1.p1  ORF type:complete len:118 (-),score=11.61 TRINITY_DN3511_c2_g1_i1:42-395(-)
MYRALVLTARYLYYGITNNFVLFLFSLKKASLAEALCLLLKIEKEKKRGEKNGLERPRHKVWVFCLRLLFCFFIDLFFARFFSPPSFLLQKMKKVRKGWKKKKKEGEGEKKKKGQWY